MGILINLCVVPQECGRQQGGFMTKVNQKLMSTKTLVSAAILTALVVVLQFMGQFIRLGPFMISLVLIPIVIGAAIGGTKIGGWLGFVFGVVVLISGDAAAFLAVDAFGTVVTVLLKGTLCGVASGLVYQLVEKKNRYLAVILAAIVCPVVNTGVFLLGCVVFFMDTVTLWANGGNVVAYMFLGLVGGNFLVELGFNLVLSPAIVRIIDIAEKKFGSKKKDSLPKKEIEQPIEKIAKSKPKSSEEFDPKRKQVLDLVACEVCSISVALIVNCIAFFNYFVSSALPIVFIFLLTAASIASLVVRWAYINKYTAKNEK